MLSLAHAPASLGPLAFVAMIPFLWLVRGVRPRRGLVVGLAFGLAYFGALLYWILLFGFMAWTGLVLASAAFVGSFGLLAPVLWRGGRPVRSALGLAALWTGIEFVRGMWPLGGFTWGGVAYTQANDRFLLPLASVTGAWGVTFVVVLVNALVLVALERGRGRPVPAAALVGACVSLVALPVLIPIPAADGRPLDVAAQQVDVRKAANPNALAEDRSVAALNIREYARLEGHPPDLGVWGENSLDPGATTDAQVLEAVGNVVQRVGAPTLVGAVTVGSDGSYRNPSLLLDGSGFVVGGYTKVHLVPFGEYVPWREALEWISALRQVPHDFTPGRSIHPLQVGSLRFGNVICYENSFPAIDRQVVADGAGFLVVTTNDASYRFTAASAQQLVMSRFRAVENARWVVHAAVSGISAFIDPHGRVVANTRLFQTTILRRTIVSSDGRTIYNRLGDWFPKLALLAAFGLLLLPRRRPEPGETPGPLPEHPRTLVVLPTYNEAWTVGEVIRRLLVLPERVDLVVVDDGSPDGTGEVVHKLAEVSDGRLRLIERPSKQGLAGAYAVGFRYGLDEGYDLVVEMDSDLSHQAQELPRLLGAASRYDLVIGSRYVPGGSVTNWSRGRVALSRAGNTYARLALGFPLHDATSGFRVFRREVLEALTAHPMHSDGYGFQIEMAFRAWEAGFAVGEAPISFRERDYGHSKISRRIVLEALWLVTVWGARVRLRPGAQAGV